MPLPRLLLVLLDQAPVAVLPAPLQVLELPLLLLLQLMLTCRVLPLLLQQPLLELARLATKKRAESRGG